MHASLWLFNWLNTFLYCNVLMDHIIFIAVDSGESGFFGANTKLAHGDR